MDAQARHLTSVEQLEAIFGKPAEASVRKEARTIHPLYRKFIEASPFVLLATSGPDGLDVSPRGDPPGFIQVADESTLLLPDRRGNNRIDSLRNIVTDPRVALIFLIPGVNESIRVNGRAAISVDPALLARFSVDGQPPRIVLEITVESVFFQCSRAALRSGLWDPARHVARATLPSLGSVLAALTDEGIDGERYDKDLADRLPRTLY